MLFRSPRSQSPSRTYGSCCSRDSRDELEFKEQNKIHPHNERSHLTLIFVFAGALERHLDTSGRGIQSLNPKGSLETELYPPGVTTTIPHGGPEDCVLSKEKKTNQIP